MTLLRDRGMRFIVSKNFMFLLVTLLLLLQPVSSSAAPQIHIPDSAHICSYTAKAMEKKHHIKQHLLTTIASIESGRWNEKAKQKQAWPWTINAQGKGYFFNTKAEAVKKIRELQAQGITSIDVGCMQINLLYHGQEFSSIEQALDPTHNVEYAAKFLRNLYETNNHDWLKAAMTYHSSVPEKANIYRKKVVETFQKVKTAHHDLDLAARPNTKISVLKDKRKMAKNTNKRSFLAISANRSKKKSQTAKKFDVQAWREAKLEEYRVQKLLARKY